MSRQFTVVLTEKEYSALQRFIETHRITRHGAIKLAIQRLVNMPATNQKEAAEAYDKIILIDDRKGSIAPEPSQPQDLDNWLEGKE